MEYLSLCRGIRGTDEAAGLLRSSDGGEATCPRGHHLSMNPPPTVLVGDVVLKHHVLQYVHRTQWVTIEQATKPIVYCKDLQSVAQIERRWRSSLACTSRKTTAHSSFKL